jgi:hypothetical protein
MRRIKEIDMTCLANHALAACAALVVLLASIAAIVIVPPTEAAAPATIATVDLA